MINCVIIEDESLAQLGLIKLVKKNAALKLISVFSDALEFENFVIKNPELTIHLIFMDIELPGINGIIFLKQNAIKIPVIITTAYHQYAMDGYELDVIDYLLKPIHEARFVKAVKKAEQYISYRQFKEKPNEHFCYVKSKNVLEKVLFKDILYIEVTGNYVVYHLTHRRHLMSHNSLKNIQSDLPNDQFIRIHKSFIINKTQIDRIEKGTVFIKNVQIAISRSYRQGAIEKLMASAPSY